MQYTETHEFSGFQWYCEFGTSTSFVELSERKQFKVMGSIIIHSL